MKVLNSQTLLERRFTRVALAALAFASISSCGLPQASDCEEEGTCTSGGATTVVVGAESPSSALRDLPSARITAQEEAEGTFPAQYRRTPKRSDSAFLTANKINPANFPISCGNGTGSITVRMGQCEAVYPTLALWDGEAKGASAEGSWQLVVRDTATTSFVWKDLRTGLLWSSVVAPTSNFCAAAGVGSGSDSDSPYDPNCNDNSTDKISHCAEITSFTQPSSNGKGGLNAINGGVSWRLPTRSDFMQADVNGLRYVVPMDPNVKFWSSSVKGGILDPFIWQYCAVRAPLTVKPAIS